MAVYKLTAKNKVGPSVGHNQIPKGTVIQVINGSIPTPSAKDICKAIKSQFGIEIPVGCCSSGNFEIEKLSK
ncbi:MAG: hypothetical protein ACI3ZQ_06155 [Candidatus Cryptobacteroides sp.]